MSRSREHIHIQRSHHRPQDISSSSSSSATGGARSRASHLSSHSISERETWHHKGTPVYVEDEEEEEEEEDDDDEGEDYDDEIEPSESASRAPSTRGPAFPNGSRGSSTARHHVPAPIPPTQQPIQPPVIPQPHYTPAGSALSVRSHHEHTRPPHPSIPQEQSRPRDPMAYQGYYDEYEEPRRHGGGGGRRHHASYAYERPAEYAPSDDSSAPQVYYQQPQAPQGMVRLSAYDPYSAYQMGGAPMYPLSPQASAPGGYFPPPQAMMPYQYPYPTFQQPSPPPPPPPEDSSAKVFEQHMKSLQEVLKMQQEAAIARDKEREAAADAAHKAALAKAAKDEEERVAAQKVAEAAKKAKEAAEADAAKKAKEAADAHEKALKEAAEKAKAAQEAHEKALKEANEKAEKAEKAEKEAKEQAKKLTPPDDAKQLPIKFIDAVQRKFVLPWKMVKTWKGMEELVQQAFIGVDKLEQHVHEGHYDMIGPNGEIILPQVWESTVKPDWTIKMQMWQIAEEPPPQPQMPPGMMDPFGGPMGTSSGAMAANILAKGGKGTKKKKPNKAKPPPAPMFGAAPGPAIEIIPQDGPAPKSRRQGPNPPAGLLAFLAGGSSGRRSRR